MDDNVAAGPDRLAPRVRGGYDDVDFRRFHEPGGFQGVEHGFDPPAAVHRAEEDKHACLVTRPASLGHGPELAPQQRVARPQQHPAVALQQVPIGAAVLIRPSVIDQQITGERSVREIVDDENPFLSIVVEDAVMPERIEPVMIDDDPVGAVRCRARRIRIGAGVFSRLQEVCSEPGGGDHPTSQLRVGAGQEPHFRAAAGQCLGERKASADVTAAHPFGGIDADPDTHVSGPETAAASMVPAAVPPSRCCAPRPS